MVINSTRATPRSTQAVSPLLTAAGAAAAAASWARPAAAASRPVAAPASSVIRTPMLPFMILLLSAEVFTLRRGGMSAEIPRPLQPVDRHHPARAHVQGLAGNRKEY